MAGSKSRRNPFPLAEGKMRGYVPSEVDAYLELVKRTYESDPSLRTPVTASDIRTKGFKLTKRGYDPRYVDAALDRLEEVLFDRERRDFQTREGVVAWEKHVAQLRRELFGRMRRERTTRFKRTSIFSSGYRISQVDAVIDQIAERLEAGLEIRVNDIRTVRFYPQRRGYSEAQVDAFLDAMIEYLISQR